ncbi:MAG: DUF4259 domain-containing protein [Asticcacaulis sp.]
MMNVWGAGPFDNDAAADLMMELEDVPSWESIRFVFNEVLAAEDYVEVTEGARAYAAAALLTVAQGHSEVSAQDFLMVLGYMGEPDGDLTELALAALKRISTGDSEIRELYLDNGSYKAWIDYIRVTEKALT